MIKNVSIRNFKSIKELDFKAKRVNVFIGEPNTGKSNILEALGMFSLFYIENPDELPIRYQDASNLFYDNDVLNLQPSVNADHHSWAISYNDENDRVILRAEDAKSTPDQSHVFGFDLRKKEKTEINHQLATLTGTSVSSSLPTIKYYQFKTLKEYNSPGNSLRPPYGKNLFDVLLTNKKLRTAVSELFTEQGYRLGLRHKGRDIEATKIVDDLLYAYPYQTISDTLQRIVFYYSVIETNKNATILLEEPESHMSARYIRDIAERIALDTDNQYFLVTHNPYFLSTIAEKTKPKDLAIFVTNLDNYQTQLTQLTPDHITDLLDLDAAVFLNLDKLTSLESVH